MFKFLSTIVIVALAASPALAHGGQYKGPSDAGSGGSGSSGSVAPPTNPGGAAAPGPGAATSGAASTGGARTGGGRVARGQSGRRGATTSGGAVEDLKGFDIWEFWWENNKDAYLNLKNRLQSTTNVSGSPGLLTGRGAKRNVDQSRRPTRVMIDNEVIPALQQVVKTEQDNDILDSAALALGRSTDGVMAASVLESLTPLFSHSNLSVQSSTALALGVLGDPSAVPTLQELLQDSSAGRRMIGGGGNLHWLVRAFAALSLGLIGDDAGIQSLMDVVERLPDTDRDIKICAIVGMGMLPSDHPMAARVRDFLEGQLNERRLNPLIKSFVPTSLGKLGLRESLPAIHAAFLDRDTDNLVIQSSAMALGLLASPEDKEVIETLFDYIEEGREAQTRHFAIIALCQIGSRDPANIESPFHAKLKDMLFKEIAGKGKQQSHRSWASLGSAVYVKDIPDLHADFGDRIMAAYEDESDPSFKSAHAVALGLLKYSAAADMIAKDFADTTDQDFRGYAGVALGFMQYDEAAESLRALCRNKATVPTLRLQAATGLGLMSDTQAVDTLITTLEGAQTLGVSSAVAKALGLIGDQDSIQPLKKIVADPETKQLTRAFACVALGIVAEKTDLPWNTAISANNNYRAKTESIEEVLDIL